jgi:hypothetical protein
MAKKKAAAKFNKSKEIREYKQANPSHGPKQIAEALSAKGLDVTAQFVSTVLTNSKKKTKIGKPGRPKGSKNVKRGPGRPPKAAPSSGNGVSLDSLLLVKRIVAEVGGIDKARSALTALERLMD